MKAEALSETLTSMSDEELAMMLILVTYDTERLREQVEAVILDRSYAQQDQLVLPVNDLEIMVMAAAGLSVGV